MMKLSSLETTLMLPGFCELNLLFHVLGNFELAEVEHCFIAFFPSRYDIGFLTFGMEEDQSYFKAAASLSLIVRTGDDLRPLFSCISLHTELLVEPAMMSTLRKLGMVGNGS